MMRYSKVFIICLTFICYSLAIKSQTLTGLKENTLIKQFIVENSRTSLKSTLNPVIPIDTLPFFEDFSTNTYDFSNKNLFPNPQKWVDKNAFINCNYPVIPVSIGAATLDIIDEDGNVYNIGSQTAIADVLTSQPFLLNKYNIPGKTIYLSFFYEAGGNGEDPEEDDSLSVEFYAPNSDQWYYAWGVHNIETDTFLRQILEVPDSLCVDNFQFRFKNYASLSQLDFVGGKGAMSNVDMWHIDYIRMDTNSFEDHSYVYDIAFINPLLSTFWEYESMPWEHVDSAVIIGKRDVIPITIRTNNQPPSNLEGVANIGRAYYVKDLNSGNYIKEPNIPDNQEMPFNSIITRNDFFNSEIHNTGTEFGLIEVGAFIETPDTINTKINDTVKRIEVYKDYYAYDDGSAEFGFGFTQALTFFVNQNRVYKTDSLRAVDICFNKTKGNYNADVPFKVCVWNYRNGKPGDLLYLSENDNYQDTSLSYNGFKRYYLDSALFVYEYIYVGIKQLTNDFLNVGYDINNKNKNKIFFFTETSWDNPGVNFPDGSLMIRPVFSQEPIYSSIDKILYKPDMIIAPNPADDYIQIQINDNSEYLEEVRILNIMGKQILQIKNPEEYINIEYLSSGLYIIHGITNKGNSISTKFTKK